MASPLSAPPQARRTSVGRSAHRGRPATSGPTSWSRGVLRFTHPASSPLGETRPWLGGSRGSRGARSVANLISRQQVLGLALPARSPAQVASKAMTHKIEGGVVYLAPSARDEVNRRRAMRAIVVSSIGLLVTSAFELFITALSGSVALLSDALHNLGDVFTTVGSTSGSERRDASQPADIPTAMAGQRTSRGSRSSRRSGAARYLPDSSPTPSSFRAAARHT
jgi:hypothetical protein